MTLNVFDLLRAGEYKVTEPLDQEEQQVLDALISQPAGEKIMIKGNKQVSVETGLSRNRVSKVRKSLAEKIDIIERGF